MSILIKGMDKPKTCLYCPFKFEPFEGTWFCRLGSDELSSDDVTHLVLNDWTAEWCPIKEVPDENSVN